MSLMFKFRERLRPNQQVGTMTKRRIEFLPSSLGFPICSAV